MGGLSNKANQSGPKKGGKNRGKYPTTGNLQQFLMRKERPGPEAGSGLPNAYALEGNSTQAKISYDLSNDPTEKNGNTIPNHFDTAPQAPPVQRKQNTTEEDPEVQEKAAGNGNPQQISTLAGAPSAPPPEGGPDSGDNLESQLANSGPGKPLEPGVQNKMEDGFGQDFSDVKVHTDSAAVQMNEQLNSRAFTHQNNVFFNRGEYQPETQDGEELIAHELTHTVQQGAVGNAPVAQTAPEVQKDDRYKYFSKAGRERAEEVYNSWGTFWDDEEHALDQIRGQSKSMLESIRYWYMADYYRTLEKDFYSYTSPAQFSEALSILLPILDLRQRIDLYVYDFSENETAIMDEIRNATEAELAELRGPYGSIDTFKQLLELYLSYDDYYEAIKILQPDQLYDHVKWRIENARGWDDDEEAVYSALLELSPAQRKHFWNNDRGIITFFWDYEMEYVKTLCLGSERAALDLAMDLATAGGGTWDDLVAMVVAKTKAALANEKALLAQKESLQNGEEVLKADGTPMTLAEVEQQLAQLADPTKTGEKGGFAGLLDATSKDGELADNTFLENLAGDVSSEEFHTFMSDMGMSEYQEAKAMILNAPGFWGDDEQAIWDAFEKITDDKLREQLYNDEDVQKALKDAFWMNDPTDEEFKKLQVFRGGDPFEIAKKKLWTAYAKTNTDELEIVQVIVDLDPAIRKRFVDETPEIYNILTDETGDLYDDADEAKIFKYAFEHGRLPINDAIDWALWGSNSDDFVKLTLGEMSIKERFQYRLGYYKALGGEVSEEFGGTASEQEEAREMWEEVNTRLFVGMGTDAYQVAVDQVLGRPTMMELYNEEGRMMAATIMLARVMSQGNIRDTDGFSRWFTDIFSDSGVVSDQAKARFMEKYNAMVSDGISIEELPQLGLLEADYSAKYEAYVAATDLISEIAAIVVTIIVAIVLTIVSMGSAAAPSIALLTEMIGAVAAKAVIAGSIAAAGALTKWGTKELFGGEHFDATGMEGMQAMATGAVDAALVFLMAPLAEFLTVRFLGAIGAEAIAQSRGLAMLAVEGAEWSMKQLGQRVVFTSIEGLIDGVISGPMGEVVLSATSAKTWEDGVWAALEELGAAILRGLAFGGGGGLVGGALGGVLGRIFEKHNMVRALMSLRKANVADDVIETLTTQQVTLLSNANKMLSKGNREAAEESFVVLARELGDDLTMRLRKALYDVHGQKFTREQITGFLSLLLERRGKDFDLDVSDMSHISDDITDADLHRVLDMTEDEMLAWLKKLRDGPDPGEAYAAAKGMVRGKNGELLQVPATNNPTVYHGNSTGDLAAELKAAGRDLDPGKLTGKDLEAFENLKKQIAGQIGEGENLDEAAMALYDMFKNGMPPRGTNYNLYEHSHNLPDPNIAGNMTKPDPSAFRGTTSVKSYGPDTDHGAVYFANEGSGTPIIIEFNDVKGWDVNSALEKGGYTNRYAKEIEIAVPGEIPANKIKGITWVFHVGVDPRPSRKTLANPFL